jgi:hypothetical protein
MIHRSEQTATDQSPNWEHSHLPFQGPAALALNVGDHFLIIPAPLTPRKGMSNEFVELIDHVRMSLQD